MDEILAEVRRLRHENYAENGNAPGAYCDYLRQRQTQSDRPQISLDEWRKTHPRKKPSTTSPSA